MTDDQALSQMSGQVMPNVTRLLADQGTRFDHAYLTTPLCCPSRATLLTGQYGHNNGVLRNVYSLLRDKNNVLPVWLRRAGYVTAHLGKFMNLYRRHQPHPLKPAPGWDQWRTMLWRTETAYYNYDLSVNGKRVHYGRKPHDYSTRVFNRSAKRLIDRYVPRSRPLYLEIDETAPHPSVHRHHVSGCNPVPDPRDEGRFNDVPLPDPPSFNELDMGDKPSFMRVLPRLTNGEIARLTRNYQCGLDAVAGVDRSVGQIYRKIKGLHELGRTVFIFYSDNGIFHGEHRILGGKLNPYEEAASTPLIMRVPGRYLHGGRDTAHVSDPVANIDLAPTILRLAHARPCPAHGRCRVLDGRPLQGLIAGRSPDWAADRAIGLELNRSSAKERHSVCTYRGVRFRGQVLIRYLTVANRPNSDKCVRDREWERYDLTSDPFELHNMCFGGRGSSCPDGRGEAHLTKLVPRLARCAGVAGRDPRPPGGRFCD
jgi:N-acetylglucosamine-6-sulfatase